MVMGNTSLLAISTLTSEINFYTRLLRMHDKLTNLPMFVSLSVELACKQCIEDGKATECVHRLHLVPRSVSPLLTICKRQFGTLPCSPCCAAPK